ncbi:MAG: hypothetical protein H6867_00985 [Rhodospirillales bacterium]|nr:hypothetical protein [Rhodospirillales bacterium]MCB9996764.1 hypothetical protein [Rhodospirillales bacterium]
MFIGGAEQILEILPLEHEFERVALDPALIDPDKVDRLIELIDQIKSHICDTLKRNGEMGHFMAIAAAAYLRDKNMLREYLGRAFESANALPGKIYINPYEQKLYGHMSKTAKELEQAAYRFLPDPS